MPKFVFALVYYGGGEEIHEAVAPTEREAWKLVWGELDDFDKDRLEEFDCVEITEQSVVKL
jgi:hypothetical protein